jgi:hypothetical protein
MPDTVSPVDFSEVVEELGGGGFFFEVSICAFSRVVPARAKNVVEEAILGPLLLSRAA